MTRFLLVLEVEYRALVEGLKNWFINLFEHFGFPLLRPMTINNQN
jgi:hypothetical protein